MTATATTPCGVGYVTPEGNVFRCFKSNDHKGSHTYEPLCWHGVMEADGEYRCGLPLGHDVMHEYTKLKNPPPPNDLHPVEET